MNGKDDTVRAAAEKTCYFPRVYPCHFYIKNSLRPFPRGAGVLASPGERTDCCSVSATGTYRGELWASPPLPAYKARGRACSALMTNKKNINCIEGARRRGSI